MDYPSESLARKIAAITHQQDFHISAAQAKVEMVLGKPEYVIESPFHVQNYLQQTESECAERIYRQMSTNQHPPVFFYVYDGGKKVQFTTCELFEGECGWCVGDGGGWAAACRAQIDIWLDSVYSSFASDFTPMKAADRISKRQFRHAAGHELGVLDGEQTFTPNFPAEFSFFEPVPHVGVDDSASMSPLNPLYDGEEEEEEEEEDEDEAEEEREESEEDFLLYDYVQQELLARELARQQFEREEHARDMAEREKKEWLLLELERHILLSRQQEIQQGGRKDYAPQLNEFCELPKPFPAPSTLDVMNNTAIWSEKLFSDGAPLSSSYATSVASTIPEDLEIVASWENPELPRRPIPIRYVERQCPLMEPFPVPGTALHIPFLETPLEDCTLYEEDIAAEWTNPKFAKSDTIEPFPAPGATQRTSFFESPLEDCILYEEDIAAEWTNPKFAKSDTIEPFPAPGTIQPYAPFLNIPVEQMVLCAEDIGAMWINDRCNVGAEQGGAAYGTVYA